MKQINPLRLRDLFWPAVVFYDKQLEVIRSVWENDETIVPAGNMLGKDYVAGFIALAFFLSAVLEGKTCRVVTTSVRDDHLRVLWGEIGRFIQNCTYDLSVKGGGQLILNHRDIRVAREYPGHYSYLRGMVSEKGEGMTGHHAERTLLVIDEASGVDEQVYDQGRTWAARRLIIGNPNPCQNFFRRGIKAGDLHASGTEHFYRRVVRAKAEDSPNVKVNLLRVSRGLPPVEDIVIPGILTYQEYLSRRVTWDKVRQCIGLDAEFYEGAEVLLYPPEWLNMAEQRHRALTGSRRTARTMGIDSAQGGDKTAFAVCDDSGLIFLEALKTPDTSTITGRTIALIKQYSLEPENVYFDAGGGGKQHVDRLRSQGYDVQAVAFGSAASPPAAAYQRATLDRRIDRAETRQVYKNKRAEMYGLLRMRLDPDSETPFALPAEYHELRRQLAPIPLVYGDEGELVLPPKSKKDINSTKVTLIELIGCSPDEADALALAVYGLSQEALITLGGLNFR